MATWRSNLSGERLAVPVEMRFIDMFMAALGALLFMAMLFVFLISIAPPGQPPAVPTPIQVAKLEILTTSLPPARAQEPYALAIAYRGGSGTVGWKINGNLPAGIEFNDKTGVLSGIPRKAMIGRFIVTAVDVGSRADSGSQSVPQALELTVEQARPQSRNIERWLAGGMLVLLSLLWSLLQIIKVQLRASIASLRQAYQQGETESYVGTAEGVTERIELPAGIYSKEAQLRGMVGTSRLVGFAILAFGGWFAYDIWFRK